MWDTGTIVLWNMELSPVKKDRDSYLEECKAKALSILDGEVDLEGWFDELYEQAISKLSDDLGKHVGTYPLAELTAAEMFKIKSTSAALLFIENLS